MSKDNKTTEKEWRDCLVSKLELRKLQREGLVEFHFGNDKGNMKLSVPNCEKLMQFGDLRIEASNKRIVIEIESKHSGGIINFLKYWPYLMGVVELPPGMANKDFYFIQIYDKPGYLSHRALSDYFCKNLKPKNFLVPSKFCLYQKGEEDKERIVEKVRSLLVP